MPRPSKHVVLSRREIGDRIRTLREERRITQVELARTLGTHQANVSQIERGVRGLTLQQTVKIARALRVSPDGLLGTTKKSGSTPSTRNERLMKRVRRIEQLPPHHQDAVVKMLDAFLDTHAQDSNR